MMCNKHKMIDNPMSRPKIADSILDIIGATPIVRLNKIAKDNRCYANILLKLESMEPCCSVKDRVGKALIEESEKRNEIRPGYSVLVEPTSGNTGIAMAFVGAAKGYEVILTMPECMSLERRVLLKAFGAKLVLTPSHLGMKGAIAKAAEIVKKLDGRGFMLQQFENPDNVKVHRETTGPEIWHQTDGKVDYIVAGVGTGGTLSGCAQFLKSMNSNVLAVAVEPVESAAISGTSHGSHFIHGIGAGFIPGNLDVYILDEVIQVHSRTAISTARDLARQEGLLVGISSGAAVAAAIEIASRAENEGKNIVVIIPSFGERYLSTVLYTDLYDESSKQAAEPLEIHTKPRSDTF